MSINLKIAIVDDDPAVRDSLEILLAAHNHETKSFPDGESFLSFAGKTNWLAVLLDVRMPGRNGLEILPEIKSINKNIPVIIMSGHADISMAVRALKNGALDFFEKPFQANEVLQLLSEIKVNRGNEKSVDIQDRKLNKLTPRELEIAKLLTDGLANKAIAFYLGISVRTVETHRAHIMSKLGIRSLSELIRMILATE